MVVKLHEGLSMATQPSRVTGCTCAVQQSQALTLDNLPYMSTSRSFGSVSIDSPYRPHSTNPPTSRRQRRLIGRERAVMKELLTQMLPMSMAKLRVVDQQAMAMVERHSKGGPCKPPTFLLLILNDL